MAVRPSTQLRDLVGGIADNGGDAAGSQVAVNEAGALDAVVPGPGDGEVAVGLLDVDYFRISVAGQASGKPFRGIQQPGITAVGGKQRQRTHAHETPVV